MYKLGFWEWCKSNHPEILIEFRDEMKKGIDELEEFINSLENGKAK